jgi:hypothetical protein
MSEAKELFEVGMEEFASRCAGLDAAALEREEKALELALDSFLPVAAAATAFKQAGEELWVPVDVWDKRWSALEKNLALAEKTSRWKEAFSIVGELKARSPVLKMYRDFTVKVCGGKDARLLGMVAWYQANIQKQAWHVWGLVGKAVDGIIMRIALLEGGRIAKGAQSNPTMKDVWDELKAIRNTFEEKMVTKQDWQKTDNAVMAGLDKKTRRGQEARRRMKLTNEMYGIKDPDKQKLYAAIEKELQAQVNRGEKRNVSKAVRGVIPFVKDRKTTEQKRESVRADYNRWKRRQSKKRKVGTLEHSQ